MGLTLTLIIVILTGLISYQSFTNRSMQHKLMFHPSSVKQNGEWYRFITHGFVHADMSHLLINMFVLYQFGQFLESSFNHMFGGGMGRILFIAFYLFAVIFSSIPDYLKHQNNSSYAAVGASGATSAIVFAFILFNPWEWFIFPPLPSLLFGVAYLWYSSYMAKRGGDRIGHNAHFWGAVFGLVVTLILVSLLAPEYLNYFVSKFMEGPKAPSFI